MAVLEGGHWRGDCVVAPKRRGSCTTAAPTVFGVGPQVLDFPVSAEPRSIWGEFCTNIAMRCVGFGVYERSQGICCPPVVMIDGGTTRVTRRWGSGARPRLGRRKIDHRGAKGTKREGEGDCRDEADGRRCRREGESGCQRAMAQAVRGRCGAPHAEREEYAQSGGSGSTLCC